MGKDKERKKLKEPNPKKKAKRGLAAGALALVAAAGIALGPAEQITNVLNGVTDLRNKIFPPPEPSPAELAKKYDKTSPREVCEADAIAKDSWSLFKAGAAAPIAKARLMHSPSCNTSWVHVRNELEGATVYKYIEREAVDGVPGSHDETPNDATEDSADNELNRHSFTMQLYAPACVLVRVELTDSSGILVDNVPLTEVC